MPRYPRAGGGRSTHLANPTGLMVMMIGLIGLPVSVGRRGVVCVVGVCSWYQVCDNEWVEGILFMGGR